MKKNEKLSVYAFFLSNQSSNGYEGVRIDWSEDGAILIGSGSFLGRGGGGFPAGTGPKTGWQNLHA